MTVVTVNGHIGSGGIEVGTLVARRLGADYVDRLILAEAARRIGATVAAMAEKEQRLHRLSDRLARFLQSLLERSAVAGASGEPFYGPGVESLVARDYREAVQEPITAAQQVEDQQFIEATRTAIIDLAQADRVVIIGRGSNIILKDWPGVLHVGLVAPMEHCIRTIMEREHMEAREAERYAIEMEKAREAFFRKFFKASPHDASLYHLVLNMGRLTVAQAVEIVVTAVEQVGALPRRADGTLLTPEGVT